MKTCYRASCFLRFLLCYLLLPVAGHAVAAPEPRPAVAGAALPYRPDAIPVAQYDPTSLQDRTRFERSVVQDRFLAIYSGSTSGIHYQVASALCRAMALDYAQHGIRCVALPSAGDTSNLQLLGQGRAQVILEQSDTNFLLQSGALSAPGARSLMSLHEETGMLVVRRGSGIQGPQDLAGKRIDLGPRRGAGHSLWHDYFKALGVAQEDLVQIDGLPQPLDRQALCDERIDGLAVWSGHPEAGLEQLLRHCDAELIGLWDERLTPLLEQRKFLSRQQLDAGTYADQAAAVQSFGIKASLIAYAPMEEDIAYWLVRSTVEHVDYLRAQHPALAALQPRRMFSEGNFLPFHPGAERYWREHPPGQSVPVAASSAAAR
ncbi:MAG: TAXI family TRAP transporter solute-binding subunit [Pseudomonas sp.]|uniref:TAXI family TRAP transporter solute-binding subunit n=1 Tax=Pseudomonas sp. TaxID=306 RepID=UPI003391F2D6